MAPSPKTAKTAQKGGKRKAEKVFHPLSRKADQMNRTMVRKVKLSVNQSKRHKRVANQGASSFSTSGCRDNVLKVDIHSFFYHALPDESELPRGSALSLEELHELIRDVWLCRHDGDIEQEKIARRKGRPKSTKEVKLEEEKQRGAEIYRTGMGTILPRCMN